MKPKVILMSHGDFAKETLRSAEMIVGPQEGVETISMTMEEGKEGLQRKLDGVLQTLSSETPVLFLVDIVSGTPCNVAVETMYGRECAKVVTGLNLGMLIECLVMGGEDIEELSNHLAEAAKSVIQVLQKETLSLEEGEYED